MIIIIINWLGIINSNHSTTIHLYTWNNPQIGDLLAKVLIYPGRPEGDLSSPRNFSRQLFSLVDSYGCYMN